MSSTQSTISFSGLASGLDTTSIIQGLTKYENTAVTREKSKEQTFQNSLEAWQAVNSRLSALQTAAGALTQPATYTTLSGVSTDTSVASFTATSSAAVGDHTLTVSQLASAQKIVSKSIASSNAALNESGSLTLNGKTIAIAATDTLADIAVKINGAKTGATATVLNVGQGDFRLTLSSNSTGAANALSASDSGAGTVLADLGLVSGAATIRQAITTPTGGAGAGSLGLISATQTVANALGAAAGTAAAGSVTIGGTSIAIDLNADSLNDIANKINAAGITGVNAQVVTLSDPNATLTSAGKQQIQIVSSTGTAPTFADSNNVLSTLGILQGGFTSQISPPQDAKFNLDGVNITRSANVISDAVPGTTIKLLKAGTSANGTVPATTATTTLSVSQSTDAAVSAVNSFVSAYNAVQDFINGQNQYTPPVGGANGAASDSSRTPLFGDSTLSTIQSQLQQTLEASFGSTTLGSIGITTNKDGDLQVDSALLTGALQSDPTSVSNLFGLSGTADNTNVRFVSAGPKTHTTTAPGYAVHVVTAASRTSVTSTGTQGGQLSNAPETLTFGGALFTSAVSITLAKGNSLLDSINQINGNSALNGLIAASTDSAGHLVLSSIKYGSATGFTVASGTTGSISTGLPAGQTAHAGSDVTGTINGEPATGSGQTLTGAAGNARTEGLQLLVTGTSDNTDYGHVKVAHGIADSLNNLLSEITDPTKGSIISAENSLNAQITDSETQVRKLQDTVDSYTQYLQQVFSNLESRLSTLQSQGSAFAAQTGTTYTGSSSKK